VTNGLSLYLERRVKNIRCFWYKKSVSIRTLAAAAIPVVSVNFIHSNVCSAFNPTGIGSRVVNQELFLAALTKAVLEHDPATDRVPGQHFIPLTGEVLTSVSAGVGLRKGRKPEDFLVREHRGVIGCYLRRGFAASVDGLAVIVYTALAYLNDPEVKANEAEVKRVNRLLDETDGLTPSYVIVAVLASAGPKPPLSPGRFVANLSGGNKEAATWSADEIRSKAVEVKAYDDTWCVVAD
jgi:hypothetical protein